MFYFSVVLFLIEDALTVDYWDDFFLKSEVYVFFGGRYLAFTDNFASVVGILLSLLAESTLFTLFVVDSIVDDLFSPDDFDAVIVVTLALLLL